MGAIRVSGLWALSIKLYGHMEGMTGSVRKSKYLAHRKIGPQMDSTERPACSGPGGNSVTEGSGHLVFSSGPENVLT